MMQYKPALLEWIETMFDRAREKQWYETYHAFDIHGVILNPDYRRTNAVPTVDYYPFAKETLQFLSANRPDMVLFLFTCAYPSEIDRYLEQFRRDNINFRYVNENPEIDSSKGSFGYYEKKPYFNTYWEDKAGFRPLIDWEPIYNYFLNSSYRPDRSWSFKSVESYHK